MPEYVYIVSSAAQEVPSEKICPELTEVLIESGFGISQNLLESKYLICFNHHKGKYSRFTNFGGEPENAALIRLEPPAVFPAQHAPSIYSKYGLVITPGSTLSKDKPNLAWPYFYSPNPLSPQPFPPNLQDLVETKIQLGLFHIENWKTRKYLVTLVGSNKVSPIRQNNYRLRRAFAKNIPKQKLAVFGELWEGSLTRKIKHRAYVLIQSLKYGTVPNIREIYGGLFSKFEGALGPIPDKHQIIENSKFSLVIENDDSYMSEKIIDAFLGGSIPIYIGGNFSALGIPSDIVISHLKNANDILRFLQQIDNFEISVRLDQIQSFLSSSDFINTWDGKQVYKKIGLQITDYFNSRGKSC